jgi:hypothetical protein
LFGAEFVVSASELLHARVDAGGEGRGDVDVAEVGPAV